MRPFLLVSFLTFLSLSLFGALGGPSTLIPGVEEGGQGPSSTLEVLPDRPALEARLGRKLKFTERLALGVMKRKVRQEQKRQAGGRPVDGVALGSLIAGGLSLVLLLILTPVYLLTALVAILLGVIGLVRFRQNPEFRRGKGMAIAGIVIGGGLVFLTIIALVAFAGAFD